MSCISSVYWHGVKFEFAVAVPFTNKVDSWCHQPYYVTFCMICNLHTRQVIKVLASLLCPFNKGHYWLQLYHTWNSRLQVRREGCKITRALCTSGQNQIKCFDQKNFKKNIFHYMFTIFSNIWNNIIFLYFSQKCPVKMTIVFIYFSLLNSTLRLNISKKFT